jgi:hypothetical protein
MASEIARWINLSLRFRYKHVITYMGLFLISESHLQLKAESVLCTVSGQTSECVGLYSLQACRHSAHDFVCLFSLTCHVRCTA